MNFKEINRQISWADLAQLPSLGRDKTVSLAQAHPGGYIKYYSDEVGYLLVKNSKNILLSWTKEEVVR